MTIKELIEQGLWKEKIDTPMGEILQDDPRFIESKERFLISAAETRAWRLIAYDARNEPQT